MTQLQIVARVVCALAAHGFSWSRQSSLTPCPRRMWLGVGVLVAGTLLALGGPAHSAILQGYSAQKIGGEADGFFTVSGRADINEAGDIAFRASTSNTVPGHYGIFKWSSSSFTPIAQSTLAGGLFTALSIGSSINSVGDVAFSGVMANGTTGAFVGNGGAPIPIATGECPSCEFDDVIGQPEINNAGVVAFQAREGLMGSIYTRTLSGGSTTLIADTTAATPFRVFLSDGSLGPGLSINAAGDVAFRAGLKSGINDSGIFVGFGNNNTMTIAQTGDLAPNGETYQSFAAPSMNDAGDVAFFARLSNNESGIFLSQGGVTTVIADTIGTFDGFTFGPFTQSSAPSVNAVGQVAFEGNGSTLYLWDGTLHRVIGIGDMVNGAEITALRYDRGGLNSAGDMPFAANLSGGDPLFVALAPRAPAAVPEPASLLLLCSGLAVLVWTQRHRRR